MARRGSRRRTEWPLPVEAFRRELERRDPLPIYALVGVERFLMRTLVGAIRGRVLGPAASDAALVTMAGPRSTRGAGPFPLADLLDELRSASLFAPRKLVVVDPADAAVEQWREELTDYAKAPVLASTLVLCLEKLDGRTGLARRLREEYLATACRALYDRPAPWERGRVPEHDSELTRWIVARAREEHERAMDLETAHLLVALAGVELGVLASALEKLSTLTTGRAQITAADVQSVTRAASGQSAFDLGEAVLGRGRTAALRVWARICRLGLEGGDGRLERDMERAAPPVLAALRWGLLRLARAHRLVRKGAPATEALTAVGVNRFFLDQSAVQLRGWPEEELHRLLRDLGELELRVKTGRARGFAAELEMLLERHLR